jgi:hypothetical protein
MMRSTRTRKSQRRGADDEPASLAKDQSSERVDVEEIALRVAEW